VVLAGFAGEVVEDVPQGRVDETRNRDAVLPVALAILDGAALQKLGLAADSDCRQKIVAALAGANVADSAGAGRGTRDSISFASPE
jgi:hypothetical protein